MVGKQITLAVTAIHRMYARSYRIIPLKKFTSVGADAGNLSAKPHEPFCGSMPCQPFQKVDFTCRFQQSSSTFNK